jgi:hypothetical protein
MGGLTQAMQKTTLTRRPVASDTVCVPCIAINRPAGFLRKEHTMTAKLNGKKLTIEIDLEEPIALSKTGKTKIVASSHGNQVTTATVDGKPVVIGLNAYIKAN